MKVLSSLIFSVFFLNIAQAKELYSIKTKNIDGQAFDLANYKGKTLLFVNIASKCGYTSQLEGLEALQKKYSEKGLVIVGIPSNDFGGQSPEPDKEFKKFCKLNYGVTFPLLQKSPVTGKSKHPVISALLKGAEDKSEIQWNFEKFIVNKNGQMVKRFGSSSDPAGSDFQDYLASIL